MKCMAITSAGLAELEARKAAFDALTDEQREKYIRARAARSQTTPVKPAPKANRTMMPPPAPKARVSAPSPKPPTEAELRRSIDRLGADIAELKRGITETAPDPASKYAGLTKQQLEDIDRVSGLAPKPAESAHTVGVRQVLGPKPVASTKLTDQRKREIDAVSFGEKNTGRVTMQGTRQVLGGFEVAK